MSTSEVLILRCGSVTRRSPRSRLCVRTDTKSPQQSNSTKTDDTTAVQQPPYHPKKTSNEADHPMVHPRGHRPDELGRADAEPNQLHAVTRTIHAGLGRCCHPRRNCGSFPV